MAQKLIVLLTFFFFYIIYFVFIHILYKKLKYKNKEFKFFYISN